jgi:hypothetical protein
MNVNLLVNNTSSPTPNNESNPPEQVFTLFNIPPQFFHNPSKYVQQPSNVSKGKDKSLCIMEFSLEILYF